MNWGPWKPWDPTRATEPPEDIFPAGTLVQVDLMIRPEWIGRTGTAHFLREFEFVVDTGEDWVLDWDYPASSHVVTRYRARGGGQQIDIQRTEEVTT
jgi:hypothetical protein